MLAKNPVFAAVAGLTLAVGIGGNTAIFTVLDAVLLRPLPFANAKRLVWFQAAKLRTGEPTPEGISISPPDFQDYQQQSTLFGSLGAYVDNPVNMTHASESERLPATTVSHDFFETLGVLPIYGRSFRPEDEQVASPETVMISYGLWQRRFGGDPGIVGQAITLNDASATVVGILPRGFQFPPETELWRPMPMRNSIMSMRRYHFVHAVGRLKTGVTLAQAQAEVTAIGLRLERQYPETNAEYGVRLVPLQDQLVTHVKGALTVLMFAVGFVLLLACINVASLLLSKAAAREKEIAIRTSLGASPVRIVRQLLTESIVLALLAGVFGVLLAYGGVHLLLVLYPSYIPRLNDVALNPGVLGFCLALSLATGIMFGLFPAVKTARLNLTETLKEGGHGASGGSSTSFFRHALVILEVAIAVILLAGAGLFMRTFERLARVDLGFHPSGVLAMEIQLPFRGMQDASKWQEFFRQLVARIQNVPGVQSVGIVSEVPLGGIDRREDFAIEGDPPPVPGHEPNCSHRRISPDYFKTMSIPLIQGRTFTDADGQGEPNVIVVSKAFAQGFFPSGDALGRRLTFQFSGVWTGTIIGIVGDIHHNSITQAPGRDVYIPEAQSPYNDVNVVVRSSMAPAALASAVKEQVRAMNPNLPVYRVRTMDQLVAEAVAPVRFRTELMGVFAAMALVLAVAGIYGVTSYTVSRRMHELGIRVALGAQPRDLLALVVKQEMLPATAGAWIGLVSALVLARGIKALLFEVSPTDPATFAVVATLLLLVALVACYVPARRAGQVDPITVLRSE